MELTFVMCQLPLSAYVGSFVTQIDLNEILEFSLASRKSSRLKAEHARKYFFAAFARENESASLQGLRTVLTEAARDQKQLQCLGFRSWNCDLETHLFQNSTFRLAFLSWIHREQPLRKYTGRSLRAMQKEEQRLVQHAKELELTEAVQALQLRV